MKAKDVYELLIKSKTVYVSDISFDKLPEKLKQLLDTAIKKIQYSNGILYDCDQDSDMYEVPQEYSYRDVMKMENFNIEVDYVTKEN